jgi:enamine deaminase RidA (YjgF/YER057c/UK114 family)
MKSFKPNAPIPLTSSVRVGGDCIALSGHTGHVVDGGIEGQLRQALTTLREALAPEGSRNSGRAEDKRLSDKHGRLRLENAIYLEFFGVEDLPARTAVTAVGLPFGALVELEA